MQYLVFCVSVVLKGSCKIVAFLTVISAIMRTRSSFSSRSLQNSRVDNCTVLRQQHVSVLVKKTGWIPITLNNLYSCDCGLTCLWTNSDVFDEKPDAYLYEKHFPPAEKVSPASSH